MARAISKTNMAPAAGLPNSRRRCKSTSTIPIGSPRTRRANASSTAASTGPSGATGAGGGSAGSCRSPNARASSTPPINPMIAAAGNAQSSDVIEAARLHLEHVAAAADRENMARRTRVFLDLLAQPPHVHAHRLLLAFEVVSPDFVEQRLARDDAPVVFHEYAQERKLFGCQGHVFSTNGQLLARRVENDAAEGDRFIVTGLNRRLAA